MTSKYSGFEFEHRRTANVEQGRRLHLSEPLNTIVWAFTREREVGIELQRVNGTGDLGFYGREKEWSTVSYYL
jgi:hypothetical protein